jgi:poly-beta-1,6-N-acetyl-D-glucosamine N-deacetylase
MDAKIYPDGDLASFAHELIATFKVHQPYAFTARLIPPVILSNDEPGTNSSPSFANLLKQFDFVTVAVSQVIDNPSDTEDRLEALIDKVAQTPGALNSATFLLHTTTGKALVPSEQLASQLQFLQQNGARNFGYYPDQAANDHPVFTVIRPAISLQTNPGQKP